jgi:hypothetical protein
MTRPDRLSQFEEIERRFRLVSKPRSPEPTLRERISRFFAENAPALVIGFVAGVIAVVLPAYVVAWVVM